MKSLLLAVVMVTVIALPFFSCKKLIDRFYPNDGPPDIVDTLDEADDTAVCRITSFTQRLSSHDSVLVFDVFYNLSGDPDSAIATGARIHYKYNEAHQLVEYGYFVEPHAGFRPVSLEGHHWYSYESGRIIKDSVSLLQLGKPDEFTSGTTDVYQGVSWITYDEEGRVIKDTGYFFANHNNDFPMEGPIGTNYEYDSSGNLVGNYEKFGSPLSEQIVYDEKLNYLRTNSIWMFLARNYSRNNEVGATGYNESGLPLGFPDFRQTDTTGLQNLFNPGYVITGNPLSITYECSTKQ